MVHILFYILHMYIMDLYIKEQFVELFGKLYSNILNVLMEVNNVEKNTAEILKFLDEISVLKLDGVFGKISVENLTDDIEYYQRIKLNIYKKSGINFPFHRSYILINHNAIAPKKEDSESQPVVLTHDNSDDDFIIPDNYS